MQTNLTGWRSKILIAESEINVASALGADVRRLFTMPMPVNRVKMKPTNSKSICPQLLNPQHSHDWRSSDVDHTITQTATTTTTTMLEKVMYWCQGRCALTCSS